MVEKKSQDFRNVYANTITFGMSDHDAKIIFGVSDIEGEPEAQVSVNLSLSTLKILNLIISDAVESHEGTNGIIAISPEKLQSFEEQKMANEHKS